MTGTTAGSIKAAITRKKHDPEAFKKLGEMGAIKRHAKTAEEESAIAKRAAKTRLANDPEAFRKLGELGAAVRHAKTQTESVSPNDDEAKNDTNADKV